MEKNELSGRNYDDYAATGFLRKCGYRDVKVECIVRGADTKYGIMRITGYRDADGHMLDRELFPNKCQTLADIEAAKKAKDIIIRFGFWTDEATGEERESMKCAGILVNGVWHEWHGKKAAFGEQWTNEPAEAEAEPEEPEAEEVEEEEESQAVA